MNITLRQLRYFVEIAQSRSLSRASLHLAIAQPALSQNIAALEEDLGTKLFKRHSRGMELSAAGQRLYERAQEILSQADALKEYVEGRDAEATGTVRLSMSGAVSAVLVAPLLRRVADQYPAVQLVVREDLSFESRAQVESGQVQLAVMPSPSELQGVESRALFEERFVLFGTRASMRRLPAEIPFADAADLPLALPDGAHDLRKLIERAAGAADKRLNVRYELNSPSMLFAVVKEGLAHSIMPASACQDSLVSKVVATRPITAPELRRIQAVVWSRDRPLTPAGVAVRDAIVGLVADLLADGRLQGRLIGTEL